MILSLSLFHYPLYKRSRKILKTFWIMFEKRRFVYKRLILMSVLIKG